MHINERTRLWRYVRASVTFKQVSEACSTVSTLEQSDILYAFSVFGILTTYYQPFSDQNGGSLDTNIIPKDDYFKKMHERAATLRNKIIAHCDNSCEFEPSRFNSPSDFSGLANSGSITLLLNPSVGSMEVQALARSAHYPRKDEMVEFGEYCLKLSDRCSALVKSMLESVKQELLGSFGKKEITLAVNVKLKSDSRPLIPLEEYAQLLGLNQAAE